MKRGGCAAIFAILLSLPATAAFANGKAYVHVVAANETLASVAELYYGDPRRESVIVAENGLTTQGGARIVVGMRLLIPWVDYHHVKRGETWAELAIRFYGSQHRAFVLIEANHATPGRQPDEDAEIVIPYP